MWCGPWDYVMWLCLEDCDVGLGTMWCDCVLGTVMWAMGLCDVIVSWGLWCGPWDYVMWLCLEDCDVGLGTMWCDCVLKTDVMGALGLCDVILSWGLWCVPWDYVMWLCPEGCCDVYIAYSTSTFFSKVASGPGTTPSFSYYVSNCFPPFFVSEASPPRGGGWKVCIFVHGHIYDAGMYSPFVHS